MTNLERIKLDAQRTANRNGKPCAVLNFNRAGLPLYVIRDVPSPEAVEREGKGWLVEVFEPQEEGQ